MPVVYNVAFPNRVIKYNHKINNDNGDKIVSWSPTGGANQEWLIQGKRLKGYTFFNRASGMYITVDRSEMKLTAGKEPTVFDVNDQTAAGISITIDKVEYYWTLLTDDKGAPIKLLPYDGTTKQVWSGKDSVHLTN